jgi:hypothetical protein
MQPNGLLDLAGRGRRAGVAAVAALALTGAAGGSALAHPTIHVLYDPSVGFSAADKAGIQGALDFYSTNMTSDFTVTVAFGAKAGGGGSSLSLSSASTYNDYYNALVSASSGGATDTSAVASLGGGAHLNNPVTGTTQVDMNSTLDSLLGLGGQATDVFAGCGGLVANACITIGQATLNTSGTPLAGLNGIVQHEFDEVLGTTSALAAGFAPNDPDVADLYRYAGSGVRSFALNPSTDVPCTGAPTAYFSVDGGATNLQAYNNCNNGGDYGDWIGVDGKLVQDAFGPNDQFASLDSGSPEVKLLDAIGYNFDFGAVGGGGGGVPEPGTWAMMILGLGAAGLVARRRPRAVVA